MPRHKCGCCNKASCNGCCDDKGSSFVMKFSGITPIDTGGAGTTTYLADRGNGAGAGALTVLTEYPVSLSRRIERLAFELLDPIGVGPTVTLNLLKNGVVVPGAAIVFGGANPLSGVQTLKLDKPVFYGTTDRYGLQVVTTGGLAATLSVSAEIAGKLAA